MEWPALLSALKLSAAVRALESVLSVLCEREQRRGRERAPVAHFLDFTVSQPSAGSTDKTQDILSSRRSRLLRRFPRLGSANFAASTGTSKQLCSSSSGDVHGPHEPQGDAKEVNMKGIKYGISIINQRA